MNKFIVFEGIDGSGKSTIAKMLNEYLNEQGVETEFTREPYDRGFGAGVRKLFSEYDDKLNARTELFLFEAARAEHVETVIKPALAAGKVVISDRFADSSVAYQGYAQKSVDESLIHELNDIAVGETKPDIVLWIDADIDVCMSRSKKTEAKDCKPYEFYDECRKYYAKRAASDNSFIRIDGNGTAEEVFERIKAYFEQDECVYSNDMVYECPICGNKYCREDMTFTYDCHGITYRLVCHKCYDIAMERGYDGEYYTEADECIDSDY